MCTMGENYLYMERSFQFLVLNSILDVKKVPEFAWTTLNLYSSLESVSTTSEI